MIERPGVDTLPSAAAFCHTLITANIVSHVSSRASSFFLSSKNWFTVRGELKILFPNKTVKGHGQSEEVNRT